MKFLWVIMLLPISAFSMDCKVDGISDSPQKMNCYIHHLGNIELLNLECRAGSYQLLWLNKSYPVDLAYHEEVEAGSNPLVFQSERIELTTTSYQIYSRADLNVDGRDYDGICFNK